jgi:pimeloyl-ACP methyl ester carboxylesterase
MTIDTDTGAPAQALPTVVLVHGAFAESASWNGVIARLQAQGHPVIAAANPLRGLQEDADQLRSVLDQVHGPVVLAGHSYGGSVRWSTWAASCWRRARAPVSWPAASPATSWGPRWTPLPSRTARAARRPTSTSSRAGSPRCSPAETAALMLATQRPITQEALEEKATAAAWRTLPSWTLVTRQDLAVPAEAQRFMAERAHSTVVEVDASHAVAVSQPGVVADLIAEAARATAG